MTTATPKPAPAFAHKFTTKVPGGGDSDLVVADLNEDGKLDLVITSHISGVVILLGLGDGTFAAAPDIEVAPGDSVTGADLNGDGHMDLVAAGDKLAVLLGKGDGTFRPPVYYAAGSDVSNPESNLVGLAVADLNADTIPDLVTVNYAALKVSALLGKGDGTFASASVYDCVLCLKVAAADLNRDGHADVLAVSKGSLFVFLSDGKGHLGVPVGYPSLGSAVAIGLGDLNGDGALDVITGNEASKSLSVLLGRGDGIFAEAQNYPAGNTNTVAVADLDGDGKLDVLAGSYDEAKLWFYRGSGDGGLIATPGIDAAPDVAVTMAVADFNGDRKPDLALYYSGSRSVVSILLGT